MTWMVLIRAMKTNTTRMTRTMMTGSIVFPVPLSASAPSADLVVVEDLAGRV
jgi:hypothetical protein